MNLLKNAELSPNNRRKRSSQSSKLAFKKTLKLGTALGAIAWSGYGRGAYAADTFNSSNNSTVNITEPDQVVTGSGFSVDTTELGGPAISISTEAGDVSFTHSYNGKIVGVSGIQADSSDGAITITTTGDVEGTVEDGIVVTSQSNYAVYGAAITIEAGNVTGGSDGIFASSYSYSGNAGTVTITANGDVTAGVYGIGIYGESFSFGGDAGTVTITANGDVTAGDYASGIVGVSVGVVRDAGTVTITANGDVTAGVYGSGIAAGSVSYGRYGYGGDAGNITITANGDVTAGDYGSGIVGGSVGYYGNAGTVTITANGDVTGGVYGSGIYGVYGSGIYGEAVSYGGDAGTVTITANGDVTAGDYGIGGKSISYGGDAGTVTITANGDVTAGDYGSGIVGGSVGFVRNGYYGNAGNVTITANGDVTGGVDGIAAGSASDYGNAGNVTITANGDVTSGDGAGIDARSYSYYGDTGNVTITANGNVKGGNYGIFANSQSGFFDAGNVTITAHDIEGESGIFATNRANDAGDVSVTADNVIGRSGQGIRAVSSGASSVGSVTITVNDVTGTGNDGIVAASFGTDRAAGNVTIRANDVTGYENGIDAESRSSDGIAGNVTITANNVTGTGERGISAISHGGEYGIDSTGNVTITANNVSGGYIGIYGTSISGSATSGDVTITANNVSGGYIGIGAYTQDGTVSVTTNGTVSGPRHAMSLFGGTVELNLNEGSVIIGELQINSKDRTNSTLNFGEGLTAVVQFDDADGEMPNTVTSPDGNHVVDGNLVYVVDGASLGAAQASRQQMNTATNGLFQSALNNRAGLTTPNGTNARISSRGSGSTSTTWTTWGTLIGSGVNQPATDNISAYSGSATALIMGVDYDAQSGVFGGLSTGQVSSDDGAGFKTKQRGIYAGVYRDLGNGSKLSFSLGATETNSERNVSGLSGLEIAKADYNSVVVNASYTKSDIFDDLDLRLSYTGTFAEGYTETASSGNLTVDDGSKHTLGVRVQKSIPMDQGGFRFGADVLRTIGQGGGITLAGQTLDVERLDTGITSRAFLGLDMDNVIAEIGVDNNGRTDATLAVKFRF